MLPLWDNIPSERVPVVNYAIILICVITFVLQIQAPEGVEQFVREFGMIPLRITHPSESRIIVESESDWGRIQRQIVDLSSPVPPLLTLVTSMFLHGGLMHIVGNLWFLYIFGDNIEDRFGHIGYALMYLICGVSAGVMHVAMDENSIVPTIGASGAIAGVMGAYLFLYPHAVVMTLVPFGVLTRIVPIPAAVFLGLWFLFQIFSGVQTNPGGGGVAWWAHVGGFLAGLGTTTSLHQIGALNPPPRQRPQRFF
jgi:membrane associated rhomboid family serine protease